MTQEPAVEIWHNPRCSKSRATLALLRERGIEPRIVEYLKEPPGLPELERVLGLLGIGPRDLLRTGEAAYSENGLDDQELGRRALLDAMIRHPVLIQRPVVIAGERAAIGRPPENVLRILEGGEPAR